MRGLKAGFAGLAMVAALGACGQGSGAMGPVDVDMKALEAHVAKLTSETIKSEATGAADLASLRALLPKEVSLTWASLAFDAATGATVLTDVKVTPAEMPEIGLGVAELRLWDFDVELLKARMQGQRLDETARLARRIDAKNISVFGLADMMNQSFSQSFSAFDDFPFPADDWPADPAEAPAEEPANPLRFAPQVPQDQQPSIRDWPTLTEPEADFFQDGDGFVPPPQAYYRPSMPKVERFDVTYGRLIFDDIVLKPYLAPPSSQGGMMLSPMAGFEGMVAITRTFGIDAMAGLDLKFDMAMTQDGAPVSFNYAIKSTGARGMRGSDLDATYARDISFSFDLGPDPYNTGIPRQMAFSMGFFGLEDMRLDKFYGEMMKGEMPAFTTTDLWSLGLWRAENIAMSMSGKQLFTAAETMLDARKFHWLVPTDLQASAKGVTIDLESIASLASMFGGGDDYDDDDYGYGYGYDNGVQSFIDGVALMKEHGLSKPSLNFGFGWNWNPGNGDARMNIALGGDGLINVEQKFEGSFPSYNAVTALIPSDPTRANPQALQRLFTDQSKVRLIEVNVTDNGGLSKIFGLASAMGGEMGGIDLGFGPSNMTGDQLRETAALGIQAMAVQASGQFPEVRTLLDPVANFLQSGGKLRFVMQPAQAMAFAELATVGMGGNTGMLSPSQIIRQLGVRTEHSK